LHPGYKKQQPMRPHGSIEQKPQTTQLEITPQ
jgi:hypothetical protein